MSATMFLLIVFLVAILGGIIGGLIVYFMGGER